MNNPLVFFVGAAVVAVIVLAGATYDRWRDWPTAFQTAAESPGQIAEDPVAAGEPAAGDAEPGVEMAGQTPPDAQPTLRKLPEDVAEAPVKEPAAAPEAADMQPAQPDEGLAEDAAEVPAAAPQEGAAEPERLAAVDPQVPEPAAPAEGVAPDADAEAAVRPSFDVVRLEEDGTLIAVGRAAPDAAMALLLDGEAIATSQANEIGEWLIMPDEPLPPGDHQLTVEARDPSGAGTTLSEAVSLAVPERSVVAQSEPLPTPSPEAEAAKEPEPAREEEPQASEPAEATPSVAEEEQLALAPLPEPETEPAPEPQIDSPSREPAPQATEVPLALETVDYNDGGDIVFSGRADPGRSVRIYVDNRFVGETTAGLDGRWMFAGREQIAPGRHTLRADLIDMTGTVSGRIELPFMRADSREIAALVEARRGAEVSEPAAEPEPESPSSAEEVAPEPEPESPPLAEQVAPEPEPEEPAEQIAPEPEPESPPVAEQVAPEPEPEAPAVADQVAPEPEPESPAVAEQVAPEPEPEAPVVAEAVAPEPEPEAPAVAEQVAPEPEPEAPAVAEQVAPEAEPEAPAVAEQVAPEPEPEAPAVAEQVAPEPESEAPTVAEQVAPEPEPEAPSVLEQVAPEPEPAPAVAEQVAPEPEPEAPAVAEVVASEPEPEAPEVSDEVAPEPGSPAVADDVVPLPEPEAPAAATAEPLERSDSPVVAALEEQALPEPEVVPSGPGHVVIQPGNNLWRISRIIYGRGVEYTVIYQANREQIRDPDLIYPGQIFATPGVHPPKEIDPAWRRPLSPEDLARQEAAE